MLFVAKKDCGACYFCVLCILFRLSLLVIQFGVAPTSSATCVKNVVLRIRNYLKDINEKLELLIHT